MLSFAVLFLFGSILGWVIELFYRKFNSKLDHFVNPGFLSGPFLPIYGFGVAGLYYISSLDISLIFKIFVFAIGLTIIEYITGLFFTRIYKIKLWDYKDEFLNVQGIIAPLYSFYWTVLGVVFYYTLYPFLHNIIIQLDYNAYLVYIIGIISGIFFVDIFNSFGVALKIRSVIVELEKNRPQLKGLDKIRLDFELFKRESKGSKKKSHYFLPLSGLNIRDEIHKLRNKDKM